VVPKPGGKKPDTKKTGGQKASSKGRKQAPAKKGKGRASAAKKEAKSLTSDLIDHRLTKALSHPLRVSILAVANQREISPSEFADEFDVPLSNVSYHFRVLNDHECLELVKEVPVRGSSEHRYRGSRRGLITDGNWKALGKNVQTTLRIAGLQDLLNRCQQALDAETFDSRDDAIFFWIGGVVDEIGWERLTEAMNRVIKEVSDIEVESADRLRQNGTNQVPMTFAVTGFESPKQQPLPSKRKKKRQPKRKK